MQELFPRLAVIQGGIQPWPGNLGERRNILTHVISNPNSCASNSAD